MDTPEATNLSLTLDLAVLACAVCTALGRGTAVIQRWHVRPVGGGSGAATAGVYRVSGIATDGGALVDWTLMLRVIRPAAATWNPAAREVDHPIYWKCEALAYQSSLLAELPGGIIAPRCFAIEERADETCWLWLEEIADPYGHRWPLATYAHAARVLGRFNGAYLNGQPIPSYPWLGPPGVLRGTLQVFAYVQDVVRNPATWQHPLLQAAFAPAIADRLLQLWHNRERLLVVLERLPQTLCHKDASAQHVRDRSATQPGIAGVDRLGVCRSG